MAPATSSGVERELPGSYNNDVQFEVPADQEKKIYCTG